MIERAIADGLPAGLVLADSAYGDNSEFRRRVRCEGLGYAVGLHRTTTVWRLDLLGRRIGDPVAVGDLADAIGRGGFRRVTWREGTKGKMSSRFATERVVLAQDDLVDPSQREAVWLLMEWRMARRQRRTLPRPRCRRTCHGAARSESQAAVAHRTGVRGRQGRAWAGSLRGPLLPRLEPPCVHGAGLLRVYRRRALQGFSPSAGKTATRKRRIVTTVRTATRPERHFRDSFITVRLAVARVLATWLPRCPLCHRPRSMARLVHMPVNTDGRLPF